MAWFLVLASLFSSIARAGSSWHGMVSLDAMSFHYKEFSSISGRLIDREDGTLPGLGVTARYLSGPWRFDGSVSYHAGDVTYDGQTQTGIPVTTTTKQELLGLALRTSRLFDVSVNRRWEVYAGVGYREWTRDIQPTQTATGAPVSGLKELYRWWEVSLGQKISFWSRGNWRWSLDTALTRILNPAIRVFDFNTDLDLKERWGARLSLPWQYVFNSQAHLIVEPYGEMWEFGASPPGAGIREPDSETRVYGLRAGVVARF